jgi:hypothetical protein
MFAIDAGGQQTYLTSRWFDEHAAEFNGQKMEPFSIPGMDTGPESAYFAETVPLVVGGTSIELHNIPVLTQPLARPPATMFMACSASTASTSLRATLSTTAPCASVRRLSELSGAGNWRSES